MVGIAKARPGAARARPLPIEAREPSLVERGDPLGPGAAPADPRVNGEQGREGHGGHHEPPRRQPPGAEGQPRDQNRYQREPEAGPRDLLLEPHGVRHALLVSGLPPLVLLPGRCRRQPATLRRVTASERRMGANHLALIVKSS